MNDAADHSGKGDFFRIGPAKSILYGLLAGYFIYAGVRYYNAPENGDYASLFYLIHAPLHELGHFTFAAVHAPRTWVILGGTIFQLLTPLVAALVLIRRGDRAAWTVGAGWLGLATLDMAVYMEDARDLKLPLAAPFSGGEGVDHDWNTLFDQWDVMVRSYAIADVCSVVGYVLLFGAAAAILLMIVRGFLVRFGSTD